MALEGLSKSYVRVLRHKYPNLKWNPADGPVEWETWDIPENDPKFPSGFKIVWMTQAEPEPTVEELNQWELDHSSEISAQIAEDAGSIIDHAFQQLSQEVTGDTNISEMKIQKWNQQYKLALDWDEKNRPAITDNGKYKTIYFAAQAMGRDPAELALEWLIKGQTWEALVDGYSLFGYQKKAAVKAMTPDDAELELDLAKIKAELKTFLGV